MSLKLSSQANHPHKYAVFLALLTGSIRPKIDVLNVSSVMPGQSLDISMPLHEHICTTWGLHISYMNMITYQCHIST